MAMASSSAAGPQGEDADIVFFDVETSFPRPPDAPRVLLEFGAIRVCPKRLAELSYYETLVQPADLSVVPATTTRCDGITRGALASAPPFREVAGKVYNFLHGQVWAGHNIVRFDSMIIREAFAEIGRAPPQPKGMIDTYPLLDQRFRSRAGNMKMASLANYFGLGRQNHRSLDDARMNLEVLKYCATVLFLEAIPREVVLTIEDDVVRHCVFVEPNDVLMESIKIKQCGRPRIVIQHNNVPLQLRCAGMKVRFEVKPRFSDYLGRPKLNIRVDIPDNLKEVLEFCDELAQRSSPQAIWKHLIKTYGNTYSPTVRLDILTDFSGDTDIYLTDIYQKDSHGISQKLASSKVDVEELNSQLRGNKVDAFFSLEIYDYQQWAGIRLVAKRLDVHFKYTR